MSAISYRNELLQKWRAAQHVVFGFPYELTLKMLETYDTVEGGRSCKFYGFGTSDELDQLEAYLRSEAENGRFLQAV